MSENAAPQAEAPAKPVSFGTKLWAAWQVWVRSTGFVFILALIVALALGAILILISGASVTDAYAAMIRGSIWNFDAHSFARAAKPLTDSLFYATPLILAGLGLALGFRAGLFNIGGQGQLLFGAIFAGWAGFAFNLPPVIHLLVCLVLGIVAGALYASIAGILKATTGANEVIITIMLNSIATYLLAHLLTLHYFQVPGSNNPRTPNMPDSATFSNILPAPFKLNTSFLLAIGAAVLVWWILERSTFGFQLRAVGANPSASRTAGMSIPKMTALTMALSGALCGAAGAVQVNGTIGYLDSGVGGTIGFDAITVALLGRNKPLPTVLAGILFGAFKAGGRLMDASANVPIDMVLVLESVIVLLIAAPPFVRWLFHLPEAKGKTYRQYITMAQEVTK